MLLPVIAISRTRIDSDSGSGIACPSANVVCALVHSAAIARSDVVVGGTVVVADGEATRLQSARSSLPMHAMLSELRACPFVATRSVRFEPTNAARTAWTHAVTDPHLTIAARSNFSLTWLCVYAVTAASHVLGLAADAAVACPARQDATSATTATALRMNEDRRAGRGMPRLRVQICRSALVERRRTRQSVCLGGSSCATTGHRRDYSPVGDSVGTRQEACGEGL